MSLAGCWETIFPQFKTSHNGQAGVRRTNLTSFVLLRRVIAVMSGARPSLRQSRGKKLRLISKRWRMSKGNSTFTAWLEDRSSRTKLRHAPLVTVLQLIG